MSSALRVGDLLDRQWAWMTNRLETSKRPVLARLGAMFERTGLPWALLGGVALQLRLKEPRTTVDIDVAVQARVSLPRSELQLEGFVPTGSFEHTDNWVSSEGVPIQFSDDPWFAEPIDRAESIEIDGLVLRVLLAHDLLRAKLRAAADPERRRSKRLQDLADAEALLEADPPLKESLTAAERETLDRARL